MAIKTEKTDEQVKAEILDRLLAMKSTDMWAGLTSIGELFVTGRLFLKDEQEYQVVYSVLRGNNK